MRTFIIWLLSCSLAFGSPASLGFPGPGGIAGNPPIVAPVNIGTGTASATTSLTMTTTASIPAGTLVVVFVSINKSSTISVSSVSDGTNSYSLAKTSSWSTDTFVTNEVWYKANASAVSNGATITATLSTTSGNDVTIQAAYVSGVNPTTPFDKSNSAQAAAGCGLPFVASGTTGTLTQANEIAFGFHGGQANGGATPTTTVSSGFTLGNNYIVNTRTANHYDYQIVSATTALNNNPTIAGSGVTAYCAANVIVTFKGY